MLNQNTNSIVDNLKSTNRSEEFTKELTKDIKFEQNQFILSDKDQIDIVSEDPEIPEIKSPSEIKSPLSSKGKHKSV